MYIVNTNHSISQNKNELENGLMFCSFTEQFRHKNWPKKDTELLDYDKIIDPFKFIIRQGYRLFRKKEIKSFYYDGYDIGLPERISSLSPKERFSENGLDLEEKSNKSLLDVVFNVIFQLGIEQGRRHEKQFHEPLEIMHNTVEHYKRNNQILRLRIDELESKYDLKIKNPDISDEELTKLTTLDVKMKQRSRMLAFNEEANTAYINKSKYSQQFSIGKKRKR